MDFFDNLAFRASQTKGDVVQKTLDLSETGKLNRQLAEAEKGRKLLLEKIGERYVQLHGTDEGSAFGELLYSYRETEARMAGLRAQLREIKGIRICKGCGGEIQRGCAFCQNCGTAAPVEEEVPSGCVKCGRCRAIVPAEMKFCTTCGNLLERQQPKPHCRNCGAELSEKMRFCSKCGTPVREPEPAAAAESVKAPTTEIPEPSGNLSAEGLSVEECMSAERITEAIEETTTADLLAESIAQAVPTASDS